MAEKLTASIPSGLEIGGDYQLVWAAIDPTTGADVAGVVVSEVNVTCADTTGAEVLANEGKPLLLRVAGS
jgi:hypothetical protein